MTIPDAQKASSHSSAGSGSVSGSAVWSREQIDCVLSEIELIRCEGINRTGVVNEKAIENDYFVKAPEMSIAKLESGLGRSLRCSDIWLACVDFMNNPVAVNAADHSAMPLLQCLVLKSFLGNCNFTAADLQDKEKLQKRFVDTVASANGRNTSICVLGVTPSFVVVACEQLRDLSSIFDKNRANRGTLSPCVRQCTKTASIQDQLRFLRSAMKLKRQQRTGWLLRGIDNAESVADHSFGVALCALILRDDEVDWRKACVMALVHDLAEALVGDIVPGEVSAEEKHRRETEAMNTLLHDMLKGSPEAMDIAELWNEYEERISLESKLVKDLDRFEMILQADDYERANGSSICLQEFFDGVRGKIAHPIVSEWQSALERCRLERKQCIPED